jgi:hypothetical protein
MKLKELEEKVKENQKLKESVENEKELWKNKAKNLERSSALNKPELLSEYNKKWLTPTKQELHEMDLTPRKTETFNKINYPIYDILNNDKNLYTKTEVNLNNNNTAYYNIEKSPSKEINISNNGQRVSTNVNPYSKNYSNNPYKEKSEAQVPIKETFVEEKYNPQEVKIIDNHLLNISKADIYEKNNNYINNNNNDCESEIQVIKRVRSKASAPVSASNSEDENSDEEEPKNRIDARKLKNKKVIVEDISSDVENLSQK